MEQAVLALCEEAERKVRDGAVMLVLSDRAIAPDRLPVPAPMAVGAIQTRLVEKICAATPTLLLKPPAPVTRTTLQCCSVLVRPRFTLI